MKRNKSTFFLTTLLVSLISCRRIWGDNDLGDNFSLLEGDKIEDRVIVYCSGRDAGICFAGTFIVPIYSRHMDSTGHYAEYVETAKANDKFIIARTQQLKSKEKIYWIISKSFKIEDCDKVNCDSMIQSNVLGPLKLLQFQAKMSELKITLQLEGE